MTRREFITLLGGAAAAWPLAARAQQPDRVRRIGVLMSNAEGSAEGQARVAALVKGLEQLGWSDGRNVRIDYRWTGDAERLRRNVAELISLSPDVILVSGRTAAVAAVQQATRTVPIVFTIILDPVGAGLVESLARPSGNATGFTVSEYGFGAKWLELLKEIAPGVKQVAVIREAGTTVGGGQLAAIQAVAPALGMELIPIGVRDAGEIERGVTVFARSPNGALIVTLAARHKLPAVYYGRFFVTAGGLMSYGPDYLEQHWRAAGYVDRILKGEKPADLPVQAPTKYELVINLKTAKALGLDVPPTLLVRADEVIE